MQDVRGHRKTGENPKDAINSLPNRDNIIGANREDHQRFRRILAHGFSAQSMLAQQPVIKHYVDQLFTKLHEASGGGTKPVDIERWFNFTTFDVIGDLAFGEPFGCLEDGTYHPWVDIIFKSIKNMAFLNSSRRLSWIGPLLMMTVPRSLSTKLAENRELSRQKVRKRLDLGTTRPDFMDAMIRKSESAGSVSCAMYLDHWNRPLMRRRLYPLRSSHPTPLYSLSRARKRRPHCYPRRLSSWPLTLRPWRSSTTRLGQHSRAKIRSTCSVSRTSSTYQLFWTKVCGVTLPCPALARV